MRSTSKGFYLIAILSAVIAVVGCVGAEPARAADNPLVTASWTAPAMDPALIAGYEITYTVDSGTPKIVNITVPSAVSQAIDTGLVARKTPYILNLSIKTVDIFGQKSLQAGVAKPITFAILPTAPGAPTDVKVSVSCISGVCTVVIQ